MRANTLCSCVFFIGLVCTFQGFSQQIFINEFLASNSGVSADEFGEYDDWVELYNPGPSPVDIGGMFVTDDLNQPAQWQIPTTDPAKTTIPPGGFLLLWFDREMSQGVLHVDAKLSAGGEDIGLFASDGVTMVDGLTFGPQSTDVSYGRMPDGGDAFQFFTTPTPAASNSAGPGGNFAAAPAASVAGGFFSNNFEVALSTATPGAEPDENDPLYTSPLPVAATTTLRARTFAAGMLPSQVTTHTYFFGADHSFPVVALSFQEEDFFDPATGIYPNYLEDWERPVHVEFFEDDGSQAFSQEGLVEIHGTGSAQSAQKSLKIKAKVNNGAGVFPYPIFPDLPFGEYKSFLLRNSGQDWKVTMFRDAFVSSLADDLDDVGGIILPPRLYLQGFRPGVAYLNGEYWGIHNLREHMKEGYIEQHFGLRDNEIDLLDNSNEAAAGNFDAWNFLKQYLAANSFASDDKMQQLGSFIDLPHFLDYTAFNVLIDNSDWPGNNLRRWRERTYHGQWRFLTFDLDFSFGLLKIEPDTLIFNSGDASANSLARLLDDSAVTWPNPHWTTLSFRKTMENAAFRRDFINRTADFLNVLFDPQRVNARIDEFVALYEPEIQQHFDRWSPGWNPWASHVQVLRKFANDRPQFLRQHFVNYFSEITGTGTVTLKAQPANGGGISISTLTLGPQRLPWSGKYFTGIKVPVMAVPAPGYIFTGWSNPALGNQQTGNLTLEGDETLVAFFEKGSVSKDTIVINEINYNSSSIANSGDWIELFNPNSHTVDISGWVFEDENGGYFSLPADMVMPAGGYLVLVENKEAFSSIYPLTTHVSGDFGRDPNGFKLSNSGELILLKNANLEVIDSVRYSDKSPWPTDPDGNGSTLQLIHWQLDNALPQSWKPDQPTPGLPGSVSSQVQVIDFPPISNKLTTTPPFTLSATASSGLPVSFSVVAGPATINGSVVKLTGAEGIVTIRAGQQGNQNWQAAAPVFRSFHVLKKPDYCEAKAEQPWQAWIERVQFGEIDHLSFKTQYGNFTHIQTEAPIGQPIELTITPAYSWQVFEENFRAWIDFNQDGDFEDDGEIVLEMTGNEAVKADVVVPADAVLGETRLRVAMRRDQFPEPCGTFDFGEVQDYTVIITPEGDLLPGGSDPTLTNELMLSPNPASAFVTAQFTTKHSGRISVSLVSTLGVTVRSEVFNLQEGEHLLEVEVSDLPDGPYLMVVSPEKQRVLVAKLLKL